MIRSFDLVIAGGGVIGLSIAVQCAERGWRVCVVERGEFGRQSSWAGAGILPSGATLAAVDPIEQLRALSHPLHASWANKLKQYSGIDNEYRRCGGLYIARTDAERATMSANRIWWEEHGIDHRILDSVEFKSHIPALSCLYDKNDETEIWWAPNDCRLRNPRHLQALQMTAELLGVQLLPNTEITGFDLEKSEILGLKTTHRNRIVGDRFCLCSGAWTGLLLNDLQVPTGIMPVRGQMILFQFDHPRFSCVINEGHRYLVPREDGYVLAGSCEEEVGFVNTTTDSMVQELRHWALDLYPSLGDARLVKSWSGLRPGSFDSYPYLGRVPNFVNLFVASGHFRHGLHWSTGTAELMQQLMFGEKTSIDLAPFQILRGNNSNAKG